MLRNKLKVIADEHIWGIEEACAHLSGYDVGLRILPPKEVTAQVVKDVDVLLTRTGTTVDASLLTGSKVGFAGTATIGDDHYDKAWLDKHGVVWATAAGSSTGSVLEYVLAALLELNAQRIIDLSTMTLGVIGAGCIGGRLASICRDLGMNVLVNDPPRQRAEGKQGFVSLDEVLRQSDILTLHTPLLVEGQDKTHHLLDAKHLSVFQGRLIINAARGACIDNIALLAWMNRRHDAYVVLDCWENEPHILTELLYHPQCVIGTPHIAGHSLDGKAANTQYIYNALCDYLKIEPTWDMDDALPSITYVHDQHFESWEVLHDKVKSMYAIKQDYELLLGGRDFEKNNIAERFVYLRRHYPVRRAWEKQSYGLSVLLKAR